MHRRRGTGAQMRKTAIAPALDGNAIRHHDNPIRLDDNRGRFQRNPVRYAGTEFGRARRGGPPISVRRSRHFSHHAAGKRLICRRFPGARRRWASSSVPTSRRLS